MRTHPWDSPGKNTGVGRHFLLQCVKVKSESEVAESWRTLSDPMDCSLPGSSVHGIFQARVLEWGASAISLFSDEKTETQEVSINCPRSLSEQLAKAGSSAIVVTSEPSFTVYGHSEWRKTNESLNDVIVCLDPAYAHRKIW